MNKVNRTLASLVLAAATLSGTAFALTEEQKEDVSKGMNDFATSVTISVPDAATQQNIWADAFIGTVFPGAHFGAGVTVAGTQLDMKGFKSASDTLLGDIAITLSDNETLKNLKMNEFKLGSIPDTFFLPTATIDARIGGFFLPFDIGITAMATNPLFKMADYKDPTTWTNVDQALEWSLLGFDGTVDYMALGADLRYCLYEGNLFIPAISIGGGYYYLRGSFAVSNSQTEMLKVGSTDLGNQTTKVQMGLSYTSNVGFLQAQASYNFGMVSVFGGARGLVSATTADWSWSYTTENENGDSSLADSESDSGQVVTEDTFKGIYHDMTIDLSKIQPQAFLGISGNFGFFQTSLSVTADCRSISTAIELKDPKLFIWSGSLGLHLKF